MSIKDIWEKSKGLFNLIILILIVSAGYGLWQLVKLEKNREEVRIDRAEHNRPVQQTGHPALTKAGIDGNPAAGLTVLASKNGKKYHFSWCPGAKQIAEKNKIWFNSAEEAQKAGYTPAANCPGLK